MWLVASKGGTDKFLVCAGTANGSNYWTTRLFGFLKSILISAAVTEFIGWWSAATALGPPPLKYLLFRPILVYPKAFWSLREEGYPLAYLLLEGPSFITLKLEFFPFVEPFVVFLFILNLFQFIISASWMSFGGLPPATPPLLARPLLWSEFISA